MKKQSVKYFPSPRDVTTREVHYNRFKTRWGSCIEASIIVVLLIAIAILVVMILFTLKIIQPSF